MTFKIEPAFRNLIEAVANATARRPSEVVRDIVVSHFSNAKAHEEHKAS